MFGTSAVCVSPGWLCVTARPLFPLWLKGTLGLALSTLWSNLACCGCSRTAIILGDESGEMSLAMRES